MCWEPNYWKYEDTNMCCSPVSSGRRHIVGYGTISWMLTTQNFLDPCCINLDLTQKRWVHTH